MEAHGAGVQLQCSAALALEMGVPIYGVLAAVRTATDKQGRSVPAPGQGILVTAGQAHATGAPGVRASPMLALDYDARIAPLLGALSVWGLTIDDIEVASFHGTGTKANDFNESEVLQRQLEHLGRTRGNALMAIFQKHLAGHPKGAAAAWMLNGVLQAMQSGIVPGNRNADNVDVRLRQFDHVVYLNRPLATYGFRAALLKSFGFGGELLIIHPDYALAQLDDAAFARYAAARAARAGGVPARAGRAGRPPAVH